MFLGTYDDNNKDRDRKRRGKPPMTHGESHGLSKLTCQDVRKIRKMFSSGKYTYQDIADMYDMNNSVIWNAINKKTWSHVI